MADTFIWWLTLEILGLVALPVAAVVLRPLPDRGYAASKILGLLLVGWLAYTLAMIRALPFGRLSLLLCLLVVAGVSAWLLFRNGRSLLQELGARYRTPRFIRYIITAEVLFALIFGVWALFKSYGSNPDIWATEKFMDFGFMNSILKSSAFPPNDMWLSGHSINYYYFGYVLIAGLSSLSGVRTEVGFNLANCTLLALTALGSFGFVYNLILGTVARRATQRRAFAVDTEDAGPPRNKQREREILEAVSDGTETPKAQPTLPSRRARTGQATAQVAAVAQTPTAVVEKARHPVVEAGGNGRGKQDGASNGRTRNNRPLSESTGMQDAQEVKLPFYLSPYIYAVLAALMVVAMGNLTTMFATKDAGNDMVGNGWKFCFNCQTIQSFNWWNPSRIIRDYKTTQVPGQAPQKTKAGNETINEFPAFSFLLADMHPHVMALPLVLLALSAAYAVSRRKILRSTDWRNGISFWLPMIIISVVIGALYTANTWDYPTYLIILLACLGLPYITPAGRKDSPSAGSRFLSWLLNSVVIVVFSLLAFLPFQLTFKSLVGSSPAEIPANIAKIPILGTIISKLGGLIAFNDNDKTILGFLVIFGIFLVALIGWLLYELTAYIRSQLRESGEGADRRDLKKLGIIIAAIIVPAYVLDIFLKSPILLLLAPLIAIAIALIVVEPGRIERNVALTMFAIAAIIGLGVEFVYLRDVFSDRMNTLFKFYYQMWVLWSLAAGYGLWRAIYLIHGALNENKQTVTSKGRAAVVQGQRSMGAVVQMIAAIPWITVFTLLMLSGLMYSIYGPLNKIGTNASIRGLDGMTHIANSAPDDYKALQWLKENGTGNDVVVECCHAEYNMEGQAGRVSSFTGVPTILSWDGHESQWRGGQPDLLGELGPRRKDVNSIYQGKDASGNPFTTQTFYTLLDKYKVDYIFVGAVERGQSGVFGPQADEHITPEAETFYKQIGLTEAYKSGDPPNNTVIYKVPPASARGGIDPNATVKAGSTSPQQQPQATQASSKPQQPTPDLKAPPVGLFDMKGAGANRGQFNLPRSITRDADGNFYVTDAENLRVEKFDKGGKFVTMWGSKGDGDSQFNPISDDATGTGPSGLTVDKEGYIYVADTWNHRIQKFDRDGKFVQTWGGYINLSDEGAASDTNVDRKFFGPRGLAFGPDGNIYVTDTGNKRVLVFDTDGNEIRHIDSGQSPTKKGPDYPFDKPGEMNEPVGLAIDKAGNVYVADTNNHRIQKFDKDGKPAAQWPIPDNGWGAGPYLEPFLAVDGVGNVYATAPTGNTVLKFSPTGQLLGQKNKQGNVTLKNPTGIYVDANGTVYVVDTGDSGIVNLGTIP